MALDPNGKYLKQVTTGAIFGWEPEFAKRSDMVPYRPGDDANTVEEMVIDLRSAPASQSQLFPDEDAQPAPEAVTETRDAFNGGSMGALFDTTVPPRQ